MTLTSTSPRVTAAGNGVTTSFPFSFTVWASSDLLVYTKVDATGVRTLKTLTTDYTVTGTLPGSGNVVMNSAPATGVTVIVERRRGIDQETDFAVGGAFGSSTIETQLDKLTGFVQGMWEHVKRSFKSPIESAVSGDSVEAEITAARAGQFLTINSAGDGLSWTALVSATLYTLSSYGVSLAQAANAGAAQTLLGMSTFFKTLLAAADFKGLLTIFGIKYGSATIDFANVSDNATVAGNVDITVTGAVVGDFVWMSANGDIATTLGALLYGKVVSADTLRPYLANDSAGSFNAASQTVNYILIPKSLLGL